MGSISITTTTYGIPRQVVKLYLTLSKVDSIISGRALSCRCRERAAAGRCLEAFIDEYGKPAPSSSLAWQHGRAHGEADEPGRRLSLDPPGGRCADLKQPSSSGEGIEKTEVCRVASHGGYGGRQRIATFWAEDAPGIITKVATRRLGSGEHLNYIHAVRENAHASTGSWCCRRPGRAGEAFDQAN
jgi:hypothetical protein